MIVVFASIGGLLTFALYNTPTISFPEVSHGLPVMILVFDLKYFSYNVQVTCQKMQCKPEFPLLYINTTHKNNV